MCVIMCNSTVLHINSWHKASQAADGFARITVGHTETHCAVLVSLQALWLGKKKTKFYIVCRTFKNLLNIFK